MNDNTKELLYRVRKVRGTYMTIFFGIIGVLLLIGNSIIQTIITINPEIIINLESVTFRYIGINIPIHILLRVLFGFCIVFSIFTWYDGLIIEFIKIIFIVFLSMFLFYPTTNLVINVDFGTYELSFNAILQIFIYLFLFVEIINIFLELYRYKCNSNANKEYNLREAKDLEDNSTMNPMSDLIFHALFRGPHEYYWFDNEYQKPKMNSNSKFINTEWVTQRTKFFTSNSEKMKDIGYLYLCAFLYALITFVIVDEMKFPMDATMRAFSFPIMMYFMLGFRSTGKLIKSAITMIFYLYFQLLMFDAGMITANGMFHLYYVNYAIYALYLIFTFFINPIEFANGMLNGFISPIDPLDIEYIAGMTDTVMSIYYTYASILCILIQLSVWFFSKRNCKSAIIISDENIFIRDKERTSRLNDIKLGLCLLISPFSPNNYRNAFRRIQYNHMASIDGGEFDYGKIPYSAIKKARIAHAFPWYEKLIIILVVFMSGYSFISQTIEDPNIVDLLIQFLLIVISIMIYRHNNRKRDLYDLKLTFNRSLIRGSWICGHNYTSLQLKDVSHDFLQNIIQFCDDEIISKSKRKKYSRRFNFSFILHYLIDNNYQ